MAIPFNKKLEKDTARLYCNATAASNITVNDTDYTIPFDSLGTKSGTNNVFNFDDSTNSIIVNKQGWYEIGCMLGIQTTSNSNSMLYLYMNGKYVRRCYITYNTDTKLDTVHFSTVFPINVGSILKFVLKDCNGLIWTSDLVNTNAYIKEL
ncbi:hypothetical protein [uncultured Clostridium sp.]|uniref:hypothetical protein n=1 Tax=uncultured Clostridium sp. TaxID=59620 RepID=UPI0026EA9252|nr:hypothetical protein [uncultured Clostridium sp.]